MSIILDALKKAEGQDKNKTGEVSADSTTSEKTVPTGLGVNSSQMPPSPPVYSSSSKKKPDDAARKRVIIMAVALIVMLGGVLFKDSLKNVPVLGKLTTLFQKEEAPSGGLQPVVDPTVLVATAPETASTPSQSATPIVAPTGGVPVTAVTGTTTPATPPTAASTPLLNGADPQAVVADPEIENLKQSAEENFSNGDYEASVTDYRNLVIKDPTNPEVHNNYGVALRKAGLLEQAESSYGTALKLDPNYTQAMNNLAVVYMSQSQYVKAKELLKKAVELDPEYIDAHLHLGICLEKNGELEAAKGYFESFLKLSEFWKNYDKQDARKIRLLVEDRLAGLKEK